LSDHQVDIAVICSEAYRHCSLSAQAAAAGVHVIQDKPLATSRAELQPLKAALQKHDVKFMMWNRNFLPAMAHARQEIASGALGDLQSIHVDFYFAKDAGPPKSVRRQGYPPMDWHQYQIAAHIDGSDGGVGPDPIGELQNEGIYPLGFILGLTAARFRRVFASSAAHFHQLNADNGVEDLAAMTLEMDDGLVGSIALGRIGLASHPSGGEIKLRVVGSRGAMVFHEARPEVGVYYRQQPAGEPRQRRVAVENDFLLADHFVQSLDENRQPFMNFEDSLKVFECIQAALQSCRCGQPVDLL
jgi:predicted dehydrogenase